MIVRALEYSQNHSVLQGQNSCARFRAANSYLLRHEDDEAVLLKRVTRQGLRVVVHDLAVSDKLLRLRGMSMRLRDFSLQVSNLDK